MFYLAYGSNLHPHRLTVRIASAQHVGNVEMPGHRLSFDKRSRDGSAKCMFVETGASEDILLGAVYSINSSEKPRLDSIEGVGKGYDEKQLSVVVDGNAIEVFTYVAAPTHVEPQLLPFDWYKQLVILGAEYQRFPAAYVDAIRLVPAMADTDRNRQQRIGSIIEQMRLINARDYAAI